MFSKQTPATLVLENGSVYRGSSFGYEGPALGEVCFNTSMTGYQEILTDPSYYRQIVTMTYPMMGNYGVSDSLNESARIQCSALIVKQYVDRPSRFISQESLGAFLKRQQIPGLQGIDTRQLVLELRSAGAMRGGIFVGGDYQPEMLEQVLASPQMTGADLASLVSTKEKYSYGQHAGKRFRVAVLDFGVKTNILRMLDAAGFAVDVFPGTTSADDLLAADYHAFFFSNGPGDPQPLEYAVKTVRQIISKGKPSFGICLGHQIIGIADGHPSFKLKFGHRGGNQPVKNFASGRVEITSQNHGFAVRRNEQAGTQLTHINLNDQTVEGFASVERNLMCVQYHPEASPGPHDSAYLFDDFYQMTERFYAG